MPAKTIVAVIGDTHIGSTTALSPLKFEVHSARLDEVQICEANIAGKWTHDCWAEYWAYVRSLIYVRNRKVSRLIIAWMGDIVDGIHHGTNQIMPELADQIAAAHALMEPVIGMADINIGIIGTEAHAGNSGDTEHGIYRSFEFAHIGHHAMVDIDGKVYDFAHHSYGGANPTKRIHDEVLVDCAQQGTPIPHYIFRAHTHTIRDSGATFPATRVILTPSFQLKTAYAQAKFPNQRRSDIGGILCVDGVIDFERARYKAQPDSRRIVKL